MSKSKSLPATFSEAGTALLRKLKDVSAVISLPPVPGMVNPALLAPLLQYLSVDLRKYQVAGVVWALRRERGPEFLHGPTHLSAMDPSSDLKGGIIADDCGLGKTVQLIALLMADRTWPWYRNLTAIQPKPLKPSALNIQHKRVCYDSMATLIVCPKALLTQWPAELSAKTKGEPPLKTILFHGTSRKKIGAFKDILTANVVITTYATLSADYKRWMDRSTDGVDTEDNEWSLFDFAWTRIVLDEGHEIRNPKVQASLAVANLVLSRELADDSVGDHSHDAHAFNLETKDSTDKSRQHFQEGGGRWVVSATPLQNKTDDLYAMVRFLHLEPLSNPTIWSEQFTEKFYAPSVQELTSQATGFSSITRSMKQIMREYDIEVGDSDPLSSVHWQEFGEIRLSRLLQWFMLRRLKTDSSVANELHLKQESEETKEINLLEAVLAGGSSTDDAAEAPEKSIAEAQTATSSSSDSESKLDVDVLALALEGLTVAESLPSSKDIISDTSLPSQQKSLLPAQEKVHTIKPTHAERAVLKHLADRAYHVLNSWEAPKSSSTTMVTTDKPESTYYLQALQLLKKQQLACCDMSLVIPDEDDRAKIVQKWLDRRNPIKASNQSSSPMVPNDPGTVPLAIANDPKSNAVPMTGVSCTKGGIPKKSASDSIPSGLALTLSANVSQPPRGSSLINPTLGSASLLVPPPPPGCSIVRDKAVPPIPFPKIPLLSRAGVTALTPDEKVQTSTTLPQTSMLKQKPASSPQSLDTQNISETKCTHQQEASKNSVAHSTTISPELGVWRHPGIKTSMSLAKWISDRSKFVALLDLLLKQCDTSPGTSAVIFSQWTRVLDSIERTLVGTGRESDGGRVFRVSRFDGSQSKSQQDQQLARFKAPPEEWEWEECNIDTALVPAQPSENHEVVSTVDDLTAAIGSLSLDDTTQSNCAVQPTIHHHFEDLEAKDFGKSERKPPQIGVILVSIQAGGAGLNLTEAHQVVLFDPTWNPGIEKQAQDRVHRIGQTRQVLIHRFLLKGTVEERVADVQAEKDWTRTRVIDGARRTQNDIAGSHTKATRLSLKQINRILLGGHRRG